MRLAFAASDGPLSWPSYVSSILSSFVFWPLCFPTGMLNLYPPQLLKHISEVSQVIEALQRQ